MAVAADHRGALVQQSSVWAVHVTASRQEASLTVSCYFRSASTSAVTRVNRCLVDSLVESYM